MISMSFWYQFTWRKLAREHRTVSRSMQVPIVNNFSMKISKLVAANGSVPTLAVIEINYESKS